MEEGLTIFDAMIRNVAGRLKKVNENKWQAVSPSALEIHHLLCLDLTDRFEKPDFFLAT